MARVLVIRNWSEFQHYKDRDPPWIKLYRDTLTSEVWVLGTDVSRLAQVASTLLAARYKNKTPLNYDLWREVAKIRCTEGEFFDAIRHLCKWKFAAVQEVADDETENASDALADCATSSEVLYSEGEQSRAEQRESRAETLSSLASPPSTNVSREADEAEPESPERDDTGQTVARVFRHWRDVHGHDRAQLDAKRRKLIRAALANYSETDLCQAISGYRNSPHHMGQNDRATVYDDIGLMLRDSSHIDAGLRFYRDPPRADLSEKTRRILEQTEGWVPPEIRHAAN